MNGISGDGSAFMPVIGFAVVAGIATSALHRRPAGGHGLFLLGGRGWLVWGFLISTIMPWHGSFSIHSLVQIFGRRRYATTDSSGNSILLSLLTMGERLARQPPPVYGVGSARVLLVGTGCDSWLGVFWDTALSFSKHPERSARCGPVAQMDRATVS